MHCLVLQQSVLTCCAPAASVLHCCLQKPASLCACLEQTHSCGVCLCRLTSLQNAELANALRPEGPNSLRSRSHQGQASFPTLIKQQAIARCALFPGARRDAVPAPPIGSARGTLRNSLHGLASRFDAFVLFNNQNRLFCLHVHPPLRCADHLVR